MAKQAIKIAFEEFKKDQKICENLVEKEVHILEEMIKLERQLDEQIQSLQRASRNTE